MSQVENLKLRNPAAPSFFDDEKQLFEFISANIDCHNLPNLKTLPISTSQFYVKNLITNITKTGTFSLFQGYIESSSVNFLLYAIDLKPIFK